MDNLILILVSLAVFLIVLGLTMRGERSLVDDRARKLSTRGPRDSEIPRGPFWQRVLVPFLDRLARLARGLTPAQALDALRAKLAQAGHPLGLQPLSFIGLQIALTLLFSLIGLWLALSLDLESHIRIVLFVILAAIGYAVPTAALARSIRERHVAIRKSLADSLDLLIVCSEAGLGFDEAVKRVVDRSSGPLAEELSRVLDDMRLGLGRVQALRLMSERTGQPELRVFVAAIHQAEMLGVGIARVLRAQSDNLRTQRDLRAREEAAKLPLKLLFPLVFCIFPSLFVVLLAPAAIQLFKALSGFGK